MGVFIRPQEWVRVFFVLVAIAVAAAFGWSVWSLVAVVVGAAMLALAQWRLAGTGFSLWYGLCLTAAWNPTGEAWVGQLIVLPRLLLATTYAVVITIVGLPFPLVWTRLAWLAWLRRSEPRERLRR